MRSILKEPLLHFLLIGAALFLSFGLLDDKTSGGGDNQVVVSAGRIEQLANIFGKTWQRPPTAYELKGLIDDFVLEEIYYRQAVAMGIDRDDTVIRRRLRQKFEFLTDDMAAATDPSDEDLAAYLAANSDAFRRDATYTFRQVYINPEQPGVELEAYVAEQLSALRAGKKAGGDTGLLPARFDRAPSRVVDGSFGSGFTKQLDELSAGGWQGPIESGLGVHVIRLESREEGTLPELAEIRPLVEREWANEMRLKARRKTNEHLLDLYNVRDRMADRRSGSRLRSAMKRRLTIVGLLAAATLLPPPVAGHEMRPGYLEIRESAADTYDVLWKVPALGDTMRLGLYVRFADDVDIVAEPVAGFTGGAHMQRMRIHRDGGLAGSSVTIDGLAGTYTDVLLRLERADGAKLTHRLTPQAPSYVIEAEPDSGQVAWTYLVLGLEHIVLGIDHLLFVLGLLLIVRDRWMLLKTITSFTLAHSITLAIATLGYASAPLEPLNATIALSILFLGPEVIRYRRGETSFTIERPWLVAFAFGLLHGFGFASGLSSIGLPSGELPLALLCFNVGVEIGQVGSVVLVVLLERSFRTLEVPWPRWADAVPGYVVGSLGAYWVIERTVIMFRGAV